MGRNRKNKIRNGSFRNSKFDLKSVKRMVDETRKEELTVILNAVLLLLPWAILFGCGWVVPVVFAQGGADVSTDLDTMLFVAGGVIVFVLAVAFALMLKTEVENNGKT